MTDLSNILPWLLSGGLSAIGLGILLGLRLLVGLQRKIAVQSESISDVARSLSDVKAALARIEPALGTDKFEEMLRSEWAAFQAIYRAEIATLGAEWKLSEQAGPVTETTGVCQRLDRAILMARAGRSVEAIMRECQIGKIDAEAVVHFHQPRQSIAS